MKPTFKETFLFWLKLGFISFGGPAGQIAMMHNYIVEKKKWISESKYLHALNYCMLLPGPEAQQLATYMGWLLHGVPGGIVAGALFIIPSVFVLLCLSILYVSFGTLPAVAAVLMLLKPAVAAIVIGALIKISKKSLRQMQFIVIAILSFAAIFFFRINFPVIIFSAIVIGFISEKYFKHISVSKSSEPKVSNDENEYYINKNTIISGIGFSKSRLMFQIISFCVLWSMPLLLFYFFTSDYKFWLLLTTFFSKAAFVTFGGAYAVLPYVAQYSVEKLNWLTHAQMMDGLALGETTPGPLIMVLAFVGFIAGYNHAGFSIAAGTVGLLTTVFYTFLPSFYFILAGAPLIEKTHQNVLLKSVLNFVSAAVVGVLANLCVVLLYASVLIKPELFQLSNINLTNLIWVAVSLFALQKFKVNMILWIAISAMAGLLMHLLSIFKVNVNLVFT